MRRTPMTEAQRQLERARLRRDVRLMVTSPEARERRRRAAWVNGITWPLFVIGAVWMYLQLGMLMTLARIDDPNPPWWLVTVRDDRLRPALAAEALLSRNLDQATRARKVQVLCGQAERAGAAPKVVAWLRWEATLPSTWDEAAGGPITADQRAAVAKLRELEPDDPWWQVMAGMMAARDHRWGEAQGLLSAAVAGPAPLAVRSLPAPWPWQVLFFKGSVDSDWWMLSAGCRELSAYGSALVAMGRSDEANTLAVLVSRLAMKLADSREVTLSVDGRESVGRATWRGGSFLPLLVRDRMVYYHWRCWGGSKDASGLATWQRRVAQVFSARGEMGRTMEMVSVVLVGVAAVVPVFFLGEAVNPLFAGLLMPAISKRTRPSALALACAGCDPVIVAATLASAAAVGMVGTLGWGRLWAASLLGLGVEPHVGGVMAPLVAAWLVMMAAMGIEYGPFWWSRRGRRWFRQEGSGAWKIRLRVPASGRMFAHPCLHAGVLVVMTASVLATAGVAQVAGRGHVLSSIVRPTAVLDLAEQDWEIEHGRQAREALQRVLSAGTLQEARAMTPADLRAAIDAEDAGDRKARQTGTASGGPLLAPDVAAVVRELRR